MGTFNSVDEIEARLRTLYLIALRMVGAAVGVEKFKTMRKGELLEKLLKIARGEENPLPVSRRVSSPERILFNGDVAVAILEFNAKNKKD